MRRIFVVGVLAFSGFALLATEQSAQGQQVLPGKKKAGEPPVISSQMPLLRPDQQGEIIPAPQGMQKQA